MNTNLSMAMRLARKRSFDKMPGDSSYRRIATSPTTAKSFLDKMFACWFYRRIATSPTAAGE